MLRFAAIAVGIPALTLACWILLFLVIPVLQGDSQEAGASVMIGAMLVAPVGIVGAVVGAVVAVADLMDRNSQKGTKQ